MTANLSVGLNRQLYYSIRPNNSENTLHAWMRHILTYLAAYNEAIRNEAQEPHLQQSTGCDGSCDCPSSMWVREVSYEEHYRKLLMNRVNVGDACRATSVDEESLRREAMLVMESMNQQRVADDEQTTLHAEEAEPMDVDSDGSGAGQVDVWDLVMYESDAESEDSDDLSYKPEGSDLLKLDSAYTSDDSDFEDDNDDNLSCYTYDVRLPAQFNGDASQFGMSRDSDASDASDAASNRDSDEYDYIYESSDEYEQDCEWDASTMD